MTRYFEYGDEAVDYLKARDKKLADAIDAIGHVYREMEGADLFAGVVSRFDVRHGTGHCS